jgi:hypothetical protein
MFGRIKQWWRAERTWRREHIEAFAEATVCDTEGVTNFQRRLMASAESAVPAISFRREQSKEGGVGLYFVADVPGTAMQLYVYPNEAGFGNAPKRGLFADGVRPYEEWSFRTPDELIQAIVDELRKPHAV